MASISTGGSGNWSSITNNAPWAGGVPPVLGDKVTILNGHTVTLDGTYSCGDDTSTALNINAGGVLKASRAVTCGLTVRGQIVLAGEMDFGTEASPIPIANTFTFIFNDSAVMANGKYGFTVTNASYKFRAYGTARTVKTTVTNITSTTIFDVADATNWQIGDVLVFGATSSTLSTIDARAITAITPGAGTTATITIGADCGTTTVVGRPVLNFNNNVIIKPSQPDSFGATISLTSNTTNTANSIELGNTTFVGIGYQSASSGASTFGLQTAINSIVKKVDNLSFTDIVSVSGSSVTLAAIPVAASNLYLCQFSGVGTATNINGVSLRTAKGLAFGNQSSWTFTGGYLVGAQVAYPNSSTAGNTYSPTINNVWVRGVTNILSANSIGNVTFNNCSFGGYTTVTPSSPVLVGFNYVFNNCNMDADSLGVATPSPYFNLATNNAGFSTTFNNCTLPTGFAQTRQTNLQFADPTLAISFIQENNDATLNDRYTYAGLMSRENSIFKRSTSSFRMDCWWSTNTSTYSFKVTAPASATLTFLGSMRVNATYGATQSPTVAISGAGITTVTATGTTTADTWSDYTLSVTNPYAYPNDLTITYTALSGANSTGAYAYFDGVVNSPWVIASRHYGYKFDNNPYVTVDPIITQTNEATVGAYTNVSISGSTITVSANATIQNIYDYCKYYLCQTSNLSVTDFFTSTDGINFSSSYNLVVNAGVALTGTFALTITGGKTLTMGAGATSTGNITHTSGADVWTRMAFSGLTTNSRVQLYDTNTSTELYNAVVAATSFEYQQNWTANHTIRYRISYVNGTTAKEFIEATGTFTSSGLSVSIAQTDDAVYIANAIDGSTVTGITITPSPARVKINLAGGTVSFPSIYAYQCYWLYGAVGIADEAAFITAKDTANYTFTNFEIRNDSATPLTLTGGWGIDSVTGTIAGMIDVAGSTGNIYVEPDHIVPYNAGTASALTLAQFIALK